MPGHFQEKGDTSKITPISDKTIREMRHIISSVTIITLSLVMVASCQNAVDKNAADNSGSAVCSTDPEPVVDSAEIVSMWSKDEKESAMATLFVADGWSCPKLLGGNASSLAWQDSADISLDGKTVSFMETSLDALGWVVNTGADGNRLSEYQRGPSRGRSPAWSVRFYNAAMNDNFKACKAKLFPYTSGTVWEWGGMKSKDGTWTYVTADPNNYNPDIYQDGVKLSFNTGAWEDDPYFDSDTGELLFWSNDRPGADAGVESIWRTYKKSGGTWETPTPISSTVNLSGSNQRQPFMGHDGRLYYSSSERHPDFGWLEIYAIGRTGPDSFSGKQRLIGLQDSVPDLPLIVGSVGEPTLSLDNTLLFIVVFVRPDVNRWDADIAYVKPGSCP